MGLKAILVGVTECITRCLHMFIKVFITMHDRLFLGLTCNELLMSFDLSELLASGEMVSRY